MATIFVPDPDPLLQPYTEERRIAAAAGAEFVVGDDVPPHLRDAEVIVNSTLLISADILPSLRRCQLIVRSGIGLDTIDVAAATACGIVVANAPTFCSAEVADHAAALILSFARRIPWLDRQVREGAWLTIQQDVWGIRRLSKLTLGVVGLGKIGQQLARRLASFGMRILGYDPYLSDNAIQSLGVTPASFADLLRESDFVSLHVPLLPSTRALIDEAALKLMKPTAVLINTSRGPVVDEPALIRALQANRLFGAALDVVEQEPPDLNNLLLAIDSQRLILTPHVASSSVEAIQALHSEVGAAIEAILDGRWPSATVNSSVVPKRPLRRGDSTNKEPGSG